MNEKYEKIIDMPHHVSLTREPMPRYDRAAQFAPYSALSGYEDAVEETARLTDRQIELDEYEKEKINSALTDLLFSEEIRAISITYFRPDEYKAGGAYITVHGELCRIDEYTRVITLVGGYTVPLDSIIDIRIQGVSSQKEGQNQDI